MRTSKRRIGTVWSFAAGTLLGAVAALALLVSPGIPRMKAEGSGRQRPVAMTSVGHAAVPKTPTRPTSSFVESGESSSPGAAARVPGHSELDLQLD